MSSREEEELEHFLYRQGLRRAIMLDRERRLMQEARKREEKEKIRKRLDSLKEKSHNAGQASQRRRYPDTGLVGSQRIKYPDTGR